MNSLLELGKRARAAARVLGCCSAGEKNRALGLIAQALRRDDPNHFAVVTVDYSYASAPPEKG